MHAITYTNHNSDKGFCNRTLILLTLKWHEKKVIQKLGDIGSQLSSSGCPAKPSLKQKESM